MAKGIEGHTLVVVISVIVAALGLIIFWMFIQGSMDSTVKFAKEVSCGLCKSMTGMIRGGRFLIKCPC